MNRLTVFCLGILVGVGSSLILVGEGIIDRSSSQIKTLEGVGQVIEDQIDISAAAPDTKAALEPAGPVGTTVPAIVVEGASESLLKFQSLLYEGDEIKEVTIQRNGQTLRLTPDSVSKQ